MPTLNKRLAGPAQVSNAAATKYTVPASTVTILRFVHVYNPSSSVVTFTMSIGTDAAGVRLYDAFPIPPQTPYSIGVYHVLAAGEIVQAFAGTNNVLTLTLTGQEITAG